MEYKRRLIQGGNFVHGSINYRFYFSGASTLNDWTRWKASEKNHAWFYNITMD